MPATPPASDRVRLRRKGQRGHYDAATLHAILDAGLVCHVGYVVDGQPYVTPTTFWRDGDHVYWHGSSASRMLRELAGGIPACLTVTHIDGLVLARTGFNHSANYRSVMAIGTAYPVEDPAEKLRHLDLFVERLFPGRSKEIRRPTAQELKATTVVGMALDEASAKIRAGDPMDDEELLGDPVWAGVVPLRIVALAPIPDPNARVDRPVPSYATEIEPCITGGIPAPADR